MSNYTSFYVREEKTSESNLDSLLSGSISDKNTAVKRIIRSLLNEDRSESHLMKIVQKCVPVMNECHQLKKTLIFYWEVIDKLNEDGKLKQEMILVVNLLRNDLLHPNEYIRGRSLRLMARMPFKQILESLVPSIMESLSHSHQYVRKNCLESILQIHLNFPNELVQDLDQLVMK